MTNTSKFSVGCSQDTQKKNKPARQAHLDSPSSQAFSQSLAFSQSQPVAQEPFNPKSFVQAKKMLENFPIQKPTNKNFNKHSVNKFTPNRSSFTKNKDLELLDDHPANLEVI